jgi:predicted dehydrogenase
VSADLSRVRLAVIGVGVYGGVLARTAKNAGLAEIVACFDVSPDRRDAFARDIDCRPAESLDALLSDPGIDGVLVATPHSTHPEIAEQAASASKHVFVEKPLALTVAGARRAIRAAEVAGVVLQVGHRRRRQPANRRIKTMMDAGELGTVLQLEATYTDPGGLSAALPAWRRDPNESPAGSMTALGVHMVDTFYFFVGRARRVAAFSKPAGPTRSIDQATTLLIEYEAGVIGCIGTSYFAAPIVTLAAYGTGGNAWNEEDGKRLFLQAAGDRLRSEQPVETLDTVADELAEFGGCIRGGTKPETGGVAGLEVAAVLEATVESARTGRSVDIAALRS